ncbi:hypothetical protein [Schlesneria sp. DSM 10557]|uniref:hypothetical protein n=1 Tax=Schlesneria sp. DSM 10557 TaxID=3044399 RepID=UPI00359FB345
MIPFRTGHRVAFFKELDSRVRQHDTDVDRLWRLQQQQSPGEPIGGDVPTGPFPLPDPGGGGSVTMYEGQLTSALVAPSNPKTSPTTCTALRWIVDTAAATLPATLKNDTTPVTLTNRDRSLHGEIGDYVQWYAMELSDGTTEFRINWIECQ